MSDPLKCRLQGVGFFEIEENAFRAGEFMAAASPMVIGKQAHFEHQIGRFLHMSVQSLMTSRAAFYEAPQIAHNSFSVAQTMYDIAKKLVSGFPEEKAGEILDHVWRNEAAQERDNSAIALLASGVEGLRRTPRSTETACLLQSDEGRQPGK